ncbi:hypothetical protein CEE37_14050 [candidate division LCP-89 bacterium B3_LCP]|uniref:Secretion system C-terminal sorting domain-containing protein n=1 Tax=candidate division LCP-89 bacterium B3_LCP TaxID=2012998 RepID=A0A532UQM6_UNCL8|nr:MAG: hypothetical protein CEE37_14050 [candidate division LCP-89 bacterium B3_LCP]
MLTTAPKTIEKAEESSMKCSISTLIRLLCILLTVFLCSILSNAQPPPQPVVDPAEWEPNSGVLITYPLWVPIEMVIEISMHVDVVTVVDDSTMYNQGYQYFEREGVNMANCQWVLTQTSFSGWTRDFAPFLVFTGNDEQAVIDFIYVEPFPFDDRFPEVYAAQFGLPIYDMPMGQSGTSNFMTDGMGVAMSTTGAYHYEPLYTIPEIEALVQEYLGIENYIFLQDWLGWTPGIFVEHIDCWAKLIDPGRVMVRQINPPNPTLEAMAEYLPTLLSSYGRPYEVIRIQETLNTNYINSLFLNDMMLVPQFGDPLDALALQTWEDALPGYDVRGFDHNWMGSLDALHCRTHELTDPYMLRIVHIPIHDRENDGNNYYLEADIHPYSNEALIAPPVIMWKPEGGSYNPIAMTFAGDDIYYGEIPQQPDDTNIYYYLEAEDGSGRVENHPYIGEGNPHHFYVGLDNESPTVEFNPLGSIQASEWPLPFKAYALDDRWISQVAAEYAINGITQPDIDMELIEPFAVYYRGTPAGIVQPGDVIEVRVKAVDTSINQNTTYSNYYTITIEGTTDSESKLIATELHPNPFNPSAVISFQLQDASLVKLTVYDISGRLVTELVNGWRDAGAHEVTFNGSELASGIYIYRIQAGDFSAAGKMVLMK